MSLPSEPWITLAEADLNDYLVAPQAAALTSAALAVGQADPWTNIMTDVVTEIRSAIRGNPRNFVSLTLLSLPPDLKRTAMALIVERITMRIPSIALSEDQRKAADIARRMIERIQDGKVVITMPPDPMMPDDQQRGAPIAVVSGDKRLFSHCTLRGL